jgi:hypothetical protein
LVLVLTDDAAVGSELNVGADPLSTVVVGGDIRVEADKARELALPPVHLVDDLLKVDPLEELASQWDARIGALRLDLIQERVRNQLKTLLYQLVVNLALALDLLRGLEFCGESRLELPKADVVEARGVHVIAGNSAVGLRADLYRPINGPIRMLGVVDWNNYFPIHA